VRLFFNRHLQQSSGEHTTNKCSFPPDQNLSPLQGLKYTKIECYCVSCIITHSMKQSPSSEPTSHSPSQEIRSLFATRRAITVVKRVRQIQATSSKPVPLTSTY
jgi:hypothetical protein